MLRRPKSSSLLPLLMVGNGIVGGMEQYVLSILQQFRVFGQRALVAAPFIGEFTGALLDDGHPASDLYVLEMGDTLSVAALAQLVSVLRTRRVDLVHTNLRPADTLGAAAAARVGVPALSTLHGLHRFKEEVLLRDLYGLEFVAVSRAGWVSAIESGLPPEAVRWVHNGVDARRFDPRRVDRDAVRARLGLGPEQVLVTCVIRLAREKSPESFVRVARLAAAADTRLVFALVGTGPLDFKLRQMISPAERDRIRLLGARRDVLQILAASDVGALTSRTESLPFSLLEAMAMALPFVSYDVGGIGEALEDGKQGFLIPFGRTRRFAEAILQLAADPALRSRMGEAARSKILARFELRRSADALLRIYRALIENACHGERGPGDACTAPAPHERGRARARPATDTGAEDVSRASPDSRFVDCHLHLSGGETAEQVLGSLDEAGVEAACLIAPFLERGSWVPRTGAALQLANDELLDVVAHAPDRLWGLIAVDPRDRSAPRLIERYAAAPGMRGVKMVPHGWSPAGRQVRRVYAVCESLNLPILFHSGVFIAGRHSHVCRPALYEAVRDFPRLRIVLAHLGWPWVDEAIAVALMDILKSRSPQILLDMSPGTPPTYRQEALQRAFVTLGASVLLFGTDAFLPVEPEELADRATRDRESLREAGAGDDDIARVFHHNAVGLFGSRPPHVQAAAPGKPARTKRLPTPSIERN
jgi:glycosyltransferase involved in cell wall biosynthesis/predicted TIM-barrel fold metal-dependent hydrolase